MKKYCIVIRVYHDIEKNLRTYRISENTNPVMICSTIKELLYNISEDRKNYKKYDYLFEVQSYENELTASVIRPIDNNFYDMNAWDKAYIVPSCSLECAADCIKIFEHFLHHVTTDIPFN